MQTRLKSIFLVAGVVGFLAVLGAADTPVRAQTPRLTVQVGHNLPVRAACFSPDGKTLASAAWGDPLVRLWDIDSGQLLRTFQGHTADVLSLAFSPDGRTLVSGGDDATVRLWDVDTGRPVRTLIGHRRGLTCVRVSPNGRIVAGASTDGTVRLWDMAAGRPLRALNTDQKSAGSVPSIGFSPDGRTLAGGVGHDVVLWDVATGRTLGTLRGHAVNVTSVCYSPDGRTLASAGYDCTINLWDSAGGKRRRTFRGHTGTVSSLSFSHDGRMLASDGHDAGVEIWDTAGGTLLRTLPAGGWDAPLFVSFSPRGGTLVSGGGNGDILLWDAVTGSRVPSLGGQRHGASAVCDSRDGRTLAVGGDDGKVRLWNLTTGRQSRTLEKDLALPVSSVSFSADGRTLAVGDDDGTISLWDVASGRLRTALGSRDVLTPINCVVFSPVGRTLASAGADQTVKLWDADTGQTLKTLSGPNDPVEALRFSADGRTLAGAGPDRTLRLWDTATGNLLRAFPNAASPADVGDDRTLRRVTGRADWARAADTSPDGRMRVKPAGDGSAEVTDIVSGKARAGLYAFDDGWAVLDPVGRFDGDAGGLQNLHYVVGPQIIALSQLKDRYYEPGLLAKLLGFRPEPLRDVAAFRGVGLPPHVQTPAAVPVTGRLSLRLTDQGGGIGRIQVFVNGKELTTDARGPQPDPTAKAAAVTVDVAHAPGLIAGRANAVRVVAWNKAGDIAGRGTMLDYTPPAGPPVAPPELYAIVVGISDYAGPNLKLRYAARDAENFAASLALSAGDMLGGRVHIHLLTSDTTVHGDANTTVAYATRTGIAQAFRNVQKHSRPQDLLVVFLAGHGVSLPAQNSLYCYLTQDAVTGEPDRLTEPIRAADTVTSDDLAAWTGAKVMPPLKQVLVLDTCAAGAAKARLALRSDAADRTRAVERLKDRVGFWVLMGCAEDAVSYESPEYGQGLLTYALLEYMRQGALEDGQVDVSRLFQFAKDEVPRLLRADQGGLQDPQIIAPQADSFPIGHLTREEQGRIPLSRRRPVVLRPALVAEDTDLGLEERLIERLRDREPAGVRGDGPPLPAFVDAADLPGALQPRGSYTIIGTTIHLTLLLRRDGALVRRVELTGDTSRLDALLAQTLAAIDAATATGSPP